MCRLMPGFYFCGISLPERIIALAIGSMLLAKCVAPALAAHAILCGTVSVDHCAPAAPMRLDPFGIEAGVTVRSGGAKGQHLLDPCRNCRARWAVATLVELMRVVRRLQIDFTGRDAASACLADESSCRVDRARGADRHE
jgi:hypothetical protein